MKLVLGMPIHTQGILSDLFQFTSAGASHGNSYGAENTRPFGSGSVLPHFSSYQSAPASLPQKGHPSVDRQWRIDAQFPQRAPSLLEQTGVGLYFRNGITGEDRQIGPRGSESGQILYSRCGKKPAFLSCIQAHREGKGETEKTVRKDTEEETREIGFMCEP